MRQPEPTQIGLSEKSHSLLKRLKEDGYFSEMVDAYRFGIAYGLSKCIEPPEVPSPRVTVFGVTTVDPEGSLAIAIRTLSNDQETPVYKIAERLADWGVNELSEMSRNGSLDVAQIVKSCIDNSSLA